MKRRIMALATATAVMMAVLWAGTCTGFAVEEDPEELSVEATVTIAVEGRLQLVQEEVQAEDLNSNGKIDIDDALKAAHQAHSMAYGSQVTSYGISMTELWGNTSGAFGYMVNNGDKQIASLADEIEDGDSIYAYVYSDKINWSDRYAYFDNESISFATGDSEELTLYAGSYDSSWNLVFSPYAGALVKRTDTGEVLGTTDAEGRITISSDEEEDFFVTAVAADGSSDILVPPVCAVSVYEEEEILPDDDTYGGDESGYTDVDSEGDMATSASPDAASAGSSDSSGSAEDAAPQTGDSSLPVTCGILAVLSAAGAAAAIRRLAHD